MASNPSNRKGMFGAARVATSRPDPKLIPKRPARNVRLSSSVKYGNDVKKRELQINRVLLHRRRGRRFTFHHAGNAFREKSHALTEVQIGEQRDALQQIGISTRAANPEIGIIISLKPLTHLSAEGQIPGRIIVRNGIYLIGSNQSVRFAGLLKQE